MDQVNRDMTDLEKVFAMYLQCLKLTRDSYDQQGKDRNPKREQAKKTI